MNKGIAKLNAMAKEVYIKTEDLILTRRVGNVKHGIHKDISFPVRLITIRLKDDVPPYAVYTEIDKIYLIPN